MTTDPTTRAERLELVKIARQRARLAKDNIATREAQIDADAEAAVSTRYAEQDAGEVQEKINAVCAELDIPVPFRPGYFVQWLLRRETGYPKRRGELCATVRRRLQLAPGGPGWRLTGRASAYRSNLWPAGWSRRQRGTTSRRCHPPTS